ncbi:MAG: class I SAM-dependent methyltransferase [Magnetococcales bacterium]|nr:class I SAM-dependent methyltransferase [Magnetococcales bacterium]
MMCPTSAESTIANSASSVWGCPVCGDARHQRIGSVQHHPLHVCVACRLQFLHPQPTPTELAAIYRDYYQAWGKLDEPAVQAQVSAMKQQTFHGYLDILEHYGTKGGSLLDIGCATGDFLLAARQRGFAVHGVEISPEGIRRSRMLFGSAHIHAGSLDDTAFADHLFDIIILSDVLEHISDLKGLRRHILRLMQPRGMLLVVTPDAGSLSCRLMGTRWPHYKPEHLFYFQRGTIRAWLQDSFQLLVCQRAVKTLTPIYCGQVLKQYGQFPLARMTGRFFSSLPDFLGNRHVAVSLGEMLVVAKRASAPLGLEHSQPQT